MSVNLGKGQSYPAFQHTFLGTASPARILPGRTGEIMSAITIQALGAICGSTCEGVTLYVDTCPEAGERGILRVDLTVAEVKHLRRVLKNAITPYL